MIQSHGPFAIFTYDGDDYLILKFQNIYYVSIIAPRGSECAYPINRYPELRAKVIEAFETEAVTDNKVKEAFDL